MGNIARTAFRDCSTLNETAFTDLRKRIVQNAAFDRIRGMFTRYPQVSVRPMFSLIDMFRTKSSLLIIHYCIAFSLRLKDLFFVNSLDEYVL